MAEAGRNNNFDPSVMLEDGVLQVSGHSARVPHARLVSRHIAIQQLDQVAHGSATPDDGWMAHPSLPAGGIGPGKAIAIGTETHFVDLPAALFVTTTWAQLVDVVTAG
jgi:hypothetical protein